MKCTDCEKQRDYCLSQERYLSTEYCDPFCNDSMQKKRTEFCDRCAQFEATYRPSLVTFHEHSIGKLYAYFAIFGNLLPHPTPSGPKGLGFEPRSRQRGLFSLGREINPHC